MGISRSILQALVSSFDHVLVRHIPPAPHIYLAKRQVGFCQICEVCAYLTPSQPNQNQIKFLPNLEVSRLPVSQKDKAKQDEKGEVVDITGVIFVRGTTTGYCSVGWGTMTFGEQDCHGQKSETGRKR